jgi:hypothetical protein
MGWAAGERGNGREEDRSGKAGARQQLEADGWRLAGRRRGEGERRGEETSGGERSGDE